MRVIFAAIVVKYMMIHNHTRLPTDERGFHISHLNLQSFNNKYDLVKAEITSLNFDVFTFSESWLHSQVDSSLLALPGYNIVRQDRAWSDAPNTPPKRGGGIGAFIKSGQGFSTQHLAQYNRSSKYIECLWLELYFEHCKNITLGIIYRPPSGNIPKFCEELTDLTQIIANRNHNEVFIMGDFNIQYNNKTCDQYKDLLQFEQLTSLSQLITDPTRHGNTIDMIFTNSNHISSSGVMDVFISDHELIYCSRKKK